jgi:predicted enzyme related to lactoylglutathione lyase
MPNNIAHFAIHADDVERARAFYEGVLGWRFEAWGPPGFFRIHTGSEQDPGIEGALHARMEPLSGSGIRTFECTVAVEDLGAIKQAVAQFGGKVVLDDTEIPTVGTLIHIQDTEGNVFGAMRYDAVG